MSSLVILPDADLLNVSKGPFACAKVVPCSEGDNIPLEKNCVLPTISPATVSPIANDGSLFVGELLQPMESWLHSTLV